MSFRMKWDCFLAIRQRMCSLLRSVADEATNAAVIGRHTVGPEAVMQYIGGALILGGILLSVVGYSGIAGYVRKVITPVVIGPVIMAIGFLLVLVAIQDNAANY